VACTACLASSTGVAGLRSVTRSAIAGTRAVSATRAIACASTISPAGTIAGDPLAIPAAKVLPRPLAGPDVVPAEFLPPVGIAVPHAVAVRDIVLPAPAIDVVDGAVDVDVVVAPVDRPTPEATARHPPSQGIASAEGNSGRDDPGADIARRRPVVWRVGRI